MQQAYKKRYGEVSPSLSPKRVSARISTSHRPPEEKVAAQTQIAQSAKADETSATVTHEDAHERMAVEYQLNMHKHTTGWYNEGRIIKMRERVKDTGTITIFISSPFDGCEGERKFFMESCLSELISLCESRGVFLDVVDMRWGITDELGRQNKTVGICLEGIDDADIFVGYFGARYGSSNLIYDNSTAPSWIDKSVEECSYRYPFVKDYGDVSVTEMEWLHAMTHPDNILNHTKPVPMFYFRHPQYDAEEAAKAAAMNDERRRRAYTVENDRSKQALGALKHNVKTLASQKYDCENTNHDTYNYCVVRDNYPSPQIGARFMKMDCENVIKDAIGDLLAPEELSEWKIPHEAFAKSRLTMYLPFDTALNNAAAYLRTGRTVLTNEDPDMSPSISKHVDGNSVEKYTAPTAPVISTLVPLVVTGPSGGGKSSLVAYLALKEAPRLGHSIYHFCGCNTRSTSLLDLLDHIYSEFVRFVGTVDESYECKQFDSLDPNVVLAEIYSVYEELLSIKGDALPNLYIFLDAVNQLVDEVYDEHSTDLPSEMKWFPQHRLLPTGLKMVVSCLPTCSEYNGRMYEALKLCECIFQTMRPADVVTREQIVKRCGGIACVICILIIRTTMHYSIHYMIIVSSYKIAN